VIATNLPSGASEITVDGETGLLVPPGDVNALATAIALLAGNPAQRKQMGIQGRKRAQEHYSRRRYMQQLRAELARVCPAP
jgi:glycosyltransferase involved in cell wall biosynthesis